MRQLITLFFVFTFLSCKAQNKTMQLDKNSVSPKGILEQVSWIQGHWKGEAFGGIVEEIWSPPLGDSMMFSFKLVVDNVVQFYELGGIRQVGETLIFQLKHFGEDFKGWEEKNETVDAKLVKIEKNKVFFEGFTFERISNKEINIYVLIEEKDKTEEVKFNYRKQ